MAYVKACIKVGIGWDTVPFIDEMWYGRVIRCQDSVYFCKRFGGICQFVEVNYQIWGYLIYWFWLSVFIELLIWMYCRCCSDTELLAQIGKLMYLFQRGAASERYVLLSIYFLLSAICWLKSQDCNRWVCTQGARVNSVILSFHQSVRVVDIIIFWKQLCFLADLLRKDKSWIEISVHLHFLLCQAKADRSRWDESILLFLTQLIGDVTVATVGDLWSSQISEGLLM